MKKLLWPCILFLLLAVANADQYRVKRFRGEDINDEVIAAKSLVNKKIVITDFMGEINKNFTKTEIKRGYRGPYHIKFNLRDSKLRCLLSKYDARNYDQLNRIRKNDRVTIVGRIEQLAFGIKRFSNPYYVLKISHIEPGWLLDSDEDIFSGFSRLTEYEELKPDDVIPNPEKYAGGFLKLKDRFSVRSTFFTVFERDINLNNETAFKFYLENSPWACYMPKAERNGEILGKLSSGQKVTVFGKLNLRRFEDDALLLFSVSKIKAAW